MPRTPLLYLIIVIAAIIDLIPVSEAIACYQCSSTGGQDCKLSSETCEYGIFGCYKMATYSGGIDKFGNFYNEENRIITMSRGCTLLPIAGADACQQHTILGVRAVICYCFNDFCNSTVSLFQSSRKLIVLIIINLFVIQVFSYYYYY
uniref:Protein quiver n=1 Tax=Syphacia muris TaxID=451379 RepID=A0A0N5APA9_9BILA